MRRGTGFGLSVRVAAPLLLACALASVALLGVGRASATALVLPDGRAWEMVSPPEKNNSLITGIDGVPGPTLGGVVQVAEDGDSIVYASNGAFEHPAGAPLSAQYRATRDAGDWSTVNITPPISAEAYNIVGAGGPYRAFSSDLSSGLWLNGGIPTPVESPLPSPLLDEAPEGYQNLFVHDLEPGAGGFRAVLTTPPSESAEEFHLEFQGATPDLSHIIFATEAVLAPGATHGGGGNNLYEWSAGEGIRLISIAPDAILGENHNGEPGGLDPISDDGSVVSFTEGVNLYARADDGPAIEVDASSGGPESGEGLFQTASSDGSRVFFTDARRLTSDSTAALVPKNLYDLYEYDLKSGQLSDLTTEDPNGAGVRGVLGASEDGSYVYFVAEGILAEGATRRCCNLYVWHRGTSGETTTKFIAALSPNDERGAIKDRVENIGFADDWESEIANRTSRVAADGLNVVFMSQESLTGYDNRGEEEVYDYNAGSGVLHCVSCDPSGAPPMGPGDIPAGTQYEGPRAIYQSRVLSDVEGRARVFFESSDPLIPQDTNAQRDVYEWEEYGRGNCNSASGCVSLISSGASSSESSFLDASANGSDVFFLTDSQLVPQDTDQLLDIYDAREGGGFPAPPAAPPACEEEEACAGPAVQAPALGVPLSASYVGVGNPPSSGSKPAVKPAVKPRRRRKPKGHGRKVGHRHDARRAAWGGARRV